MMMTVLAVDHQHEVIRHHLQSTFRGCLSPAVGTPRPNGIVWLRIRLSARIRIDGIGSEEEATFDFTEQESGYVVKLTDGECKAAGPTSKMCIVIAPPGRYFWSRFEQTVYFRNELSINQLPPIRREKPSTADDTFEIVPGALNYIGDWQMHISAGDAGQLDKLRNNAVVSKSWKLDIDQEIKSLAKLYDVFPDYAKIYEISLSMMGKESIPLAEFIKIMQEND